MAKVIYSVQQMSLAATWEFGLVERAWQGADHMLHCYRWLSSYSKIGDGEAGSESERLERHRRQSSPLPSLS